MSNLLVTGATGPFGQKAIETLLAKDSGDTVFGLVRNPEKAESLKEKGVDIRVGDYNNPESLVTAFEGIDKILFVSGSDLSNRSEQHKNVVDAATKAGVKHVVYTSFQRTNETESSPIYMVAESHMNTEKWLAESGMDYTILLNNVYMDFIPMFIGDQVLETGTIYLPVEDGQGAFALRSDMAEAAANVLTGEGHENKTYDFGNTESYSFQDVADILSEISGKEINYVSPSVGEFMKTMKEAGVPDAAAGMSAGFSSAIAQGEFTKANDDLKKLLGREPVSLKEFLTQVYGS